MALRRCTSATASAASGPNSGPSTIAPTTVTGELVTTPTAASSQLRATVALVSVSSVVKVLEQTMNSVVAGSRSRVFS